MGSFPVTTKNFSYNAEAASYSTKEYKLRVLKALNRRSDVDINFEVLTSLREVLRAGAVIARTNTRMMAILKEAK